MNEELQGKLVEIIGSIQTAAGKASDFALEQLPDVAQSYVAYGRVSTLTALTVCVGALIAYGLTLRLCFARRNEDDGVSLFFVGILGGVFVAMPAFIASLVYLNAAILVWLAPKVWLLRELAGLVK